MPISVTRELFAEIQRLIPDLPEHVTQLELKLTTDSCPVVVCEFQVRKLGTLSTDRKTFKVQEITT